MKEKYGLRLEQTSSACPEQYDVFDKEDNQVGYIRLRHGWLSVEYPICGGALIFFSDVEGSDGMFRSEAQREYFLDIALCKIHKEIGGEKRELKPCPFCGSGEIRIKEVPGIRHNELAYWVSCEECSACVGGVGTKASAISVWNTRKSGGIVGGKIPEQANAHKTIMDKEKALNIIRNEMFYKIKPQVSIKIINEALDYAISLEEVVRCKDCKFFNKNRWYCTVIDDEIRCVAPNDYCSYGGRRTK